MAFLEKRSISHFQKLITSFRRGSGTPEALLPVTQTLSETAFRQKPKARHYIHRESAVADSLSSNRKVQKTLKSPNLEFLQDCRLKHSTVDFCIWNLKKLKKQYKARTVESTKYLLLLLFFEPIQSHWRSHQCKKPHWKSKPSILLNSCKESSKLGSKSFLLVASLTKTYHSLYLYISISLYLYVYQCVKESIFCNETCLDEEKPKRVSHIGVIKLKNDKKSTTWYTKLKLRT